MKLLPVLLALCLLAAACHNKKPAAAPPRTHPINHDSDFVLNSLDTNEVFARLFDSPRIQGGTALWKPNFSERMGFRVSYDDSCHTVVDTVLHFTDQGGRNCAVVVFITYRYIVDSLDDPKVRISDCHSCGAIVGLALFSQRDDGKCELYSFQKSLTDAGIFGGAGNGGVGKYSLVSIGDSWTALLLKRPVFANMGQEDGSAELYSIEENNLNGFPGSPLTSILSYQYHHSVYDEPGMTNEEDNTALEVVKKKNQYALIHLVTTAKGKRRIAVFRYSEDDNSCIPVRGQNRTVRKR